MSHYCPTCGAELTSGTKFCSACGEKAEQQPMTHIPSPQQPQYQQQTSAPLSSPWKSKKKLIIGVLAIIIAVVIVLVIILSIRDGTEGKILGRWSGTATDSSQIVIFNFYANGSLSVLGLETVNGVEQYRWGTYAMTDKTLVLQFNESVSFEYSFSNNDNTLTLIPLGGTEGFATLTRL